MSIKKYTNIEDIDNKSSNEGQFLQKDDLFIVSKNEINAKFVPPEYCEIFTASL